MQGIFGWIQQNLEILKAIGGMLSAVVGAVWIATTWWIGRRDSREKEQAAVTASDRPQNQKQRPIRPKTERRAYSILAMLSPILGGLLVAGGAIYAVIAFREIASDPTLTVQLRVCEGEYERNCPPHDVYIYCYESADKAAAQRCQKFSQTNRQSSGGNKCGYSTTT
jgi:hypothetical protein